jgi:hypothetical protein
MEWRYGSFHSQCRRLVEVSGQRHAQTALTPGNEAGTHGIRASTGPCAGLEILEKIMLPLSGFETPNVEFIVYSLHRLRQCSSNRVTRNLWAPKNVVRGSERSSEINTQVF